MTDSEQEKVHLCYIGPPGTGLGFEMAGMQTYAVEGGNELLAQVKSLIEESRSRVIFVNENLALEVAEEMEALNQEALPAVVPLPDAAGGGSVAARNLDRLMVRAIGSDIFGNQ